MSDSEETNKTFPGQEAKPAFATVQDVAAAAGVSPATVSRVLNKNSVITPKTRSIVEDAIRDLGYRRANTPRGRRASVKAKPREIGSLVLLIPDTHIEAMLTALTGSLLHGVEAVTRSRGYHFVLSRLSEEEGLSPTLASGHVDGLIVRGGPPAVVPLLPALPVVWAFQQEGNPAFGDMVYPDNGEVGRMAARYLLDRGHRRLVIVDRHPNHLEASVREQSFRAGVENDPSGAQFLSCHAASMEAAADEILSRSPRATGVFLPLGDEHLQTFVQAMRARGLRVRDDFEVISCNNDVARLRALDPRLPNIDIQGVEVGRVSAETLLWRLEHPAEYRRFILVPPLLVHGAA